MSSQKIKIEGELLEKAKQCAEASGYASVDEFVLHTIEKEVKRLAPDQGGYRIQGEGDQAAAGTGLHRVVRHRDSVTALESLLASFLHPDRVWLSDFCGQLFHSCWCWRFPS